MASRRIPAQISAVRHAPRNLSDAFAVRVFLRRRNALARVNASQSAGSDTTEVTGGKVLLKEAKKDRYILPAATKLIQEGLVHLLFEVHAHCKCM